VGNMTRLLFLAAGLYVALGWFGLREAVWVLAMSPVAVYFPAMLVGMVKHFRSLVWAELVSFVAFLASVGMMALGWRMIGGG